MSQWERPDDAAGAGWTTPGTPEPAPQVPPTPADRPQDRWGSPGWTGGPPPAPRPGIVPLRPLGLGEIWDGGFRAFRQNPRVMVGLSAIVVVASSAITLVTTLAATRDIAGLATSLDAGASGGLGEVLGTLQRSVPLLVLSTLLEVVSVLVLNGMLIVSVSRAVLGRTIALGELWRVCRGRIWSLVVLSLLITLASTAVGALTLLPGGLVAGFADSDGGTALGVGLLLLGALGWAVLAAWLWVRWSMATPAMLLEGLGILASLKRSAALVKRSSWRTFGILLLTSVVVIAVVTAISLPFQLVGSLVGALVGGDPLGPGFWISQVVATLGSTVGSIIGYPFLAAVTALLYVDLRMRREGLDVELHRAAADG